MVLAPAERRFLISLRDGCEIVYDRKSDEVVRRKCKEAGLAAYTNRTWSITEAGLEALRAKPVKQENKEPLSSWAIGRQS